MTLKVGAHKINCNGLHLWSVHLVAARLSNPEARTPWMDNSLILCEMISLTYLTHDPILDGWKRFGTLVCEEFRV